MISDLYGSTPGNLAMRISADLKNSRCISGLSLTMLVRIFNYPKLTLDQITEKAITEAATVSSPEFTMSQTIKKQVEIINKLGLHARAAAKFVTTAAGFTSRLWFAAVNVRLMARASWES